MTLASAYIFTNPLATQEQLSQSGSQLDGVPAHLEDSIRMAGARMTQSAGVLLRLPQDIVARAIVIFTRFWIGAEGGSLREYGAKDISAASIYLAAKLSAYPKTPRKVLTAYTYLSALPATFPTRSEIETHDPDTPDRADTAKLFLDDATYQSLRTLLWRNESQILRTLGFETHVAVPHTLCITYLQALDVSLENITLLAKRAFGHLNAALLSPQLLYLTHQPCALATAAIYLAAREVGVKLPEEEWWEVFDTDREELGFVVVGITSLEGFVQKEREMWSERKVPMTVEDLEIELERGDEGNGKA